ncbi:phosphomethylpyrimidine synthase ThiC [Candidatus Bathyarchaeota archaeon]|nr:phosphomethylpyrimidine synthase ThiC [Candidatus Bathyarchaeota archaeon]
MEYAKRGIVTEEMRLVAKNEGVSINDLRQRIAKGTVIITKNVVRENVRALGIGEGLRTKVNANIGTSPDVCDLQLEVEKARVAVKYGADTVMDLSTAGDLDQIRRAVLKAVKVPVGTVPIYQAAIEAVKKRGAIVDMTEDDIFNTIEKHAKDGVDFATVHVGITKKVVEHMREHPRVTGIVSRGGTFLAAWMLHNNKENPLYSNFDYLLELSRKYDLSLSLGDALRPGCIADSTDEYQIQELLTIGDLVERARRAGVQTMVEGPGHIPLNQVVANVQLEKIVCKNAPFYVLGPLVTDIAPGYDHIVGAIGGALAGMAGADFLCYLTGAEHLGLPTIADVAEGVIVTRIAAHAVDIVKFGPKASQRDRMMAEARANLDWLKQIRLSINPEKAKEVHSRAKSKSGTCSMCGEWCVFKILGSYFKQPKISKRKQCI